MFSRLVEFTTHDKAVNFAQSTPRAVHYHWFTPSVGFQIWVNDLLLCRSRSIALYAPVDGVPLHFIPIVGRIRPYIGVVCCLKAILTQLVARLARMGARQRPFPYLKNLHYPFSEKRARQLLPVKKKLADRLRRFF